jgi:YVTN family beta-propeller protein
VTSYGAGRLDRIDPATNAVADRVNVGGSPCGIAIGPDGRIWVANLGTSEVQAVDPATRAITGRIANVGPNIWDLKAGFGSVWVVDRSAGELLRVDPDKATVVASIPIGPMASGLAVMPQGIWVSDDRDGMLRRIDPATNAVVATVAVGGAPSWFADDGADHLAVAQRGGGKVIVVDPETGAARATSAGWAQPLDGTVLGSVAWVPETGARAVGLLDLASGSAEPVRYALPGAVNPFVAEPGFGDVWVLDFGATTIWRIEG